MDNVGLTCIFFATVFLILVFITCIIIHLRKIEDLNFEEAQFNHIEISTLQIILKPESNLPIAIGDLEA